MKETRNISVYEMPKNENQDNKYEFKIKTQKYLPFFLCLLTTIFINFVILILTEGHFGLIQLVSSVFLIIAFRQMFLGILSIKIIDDTLIRISWIKQPLFHVLENRDIYIPDLEKVEFNINGWQMPSTLEINMKDGENLVFYIPFLTSISDANRFSNVISSYIYAMNHKIE